MARSLIVWHFLCTIRCAQLNFFAGSYLLDYFFSALIGYVVGSLPVAYLLVKWKSRIDIRQAGSGNVGTMNAFDVTGSRMLAVGVLVADLLKGAAAVFIVKGIWGNEFGVLATSGLSTILGHSFPVWLNFHGGRGLATTVGVMLVLGWIFIVIWIVLWTGVYLSTKSIHAGNILASVCSPLVVAIVPSRFLAQALPAFTRPVDLLYFSIVFCLITLATHRKPLLAFFQQHQKS